MIKWINKKLNICIAGEGGQGAQTIAKIITDTAFKLGVPVSYVPNYGVEQRGGVSIAFVRLSNQPITYPKFTTADIVVLLSNRSYERTQQHIGSQTKVFYNTDFVEQKLPKSYRGFAFDKLANELGSHRAFNMIVLGQVVKLMDSLPLAAVIKQTHLKFVDKYKNKPELKKLNELAIKKGYDLV